MVCKRYIVSVFSSTSRSYSQPTIWEYNIPMVYWQELMLSGGGTVFEQIWMSAEHKRKLRMGVRHNVCMVVAKHEREAKK